jgi:protein TonB
MAVSLAAHLGVVVCAFAVMTPADDAASTGDPDAIEVTIVRPQNQALAAAPAPMAPLSGQHEAKLKPEPKPLPVAVKAFPLGKAEPAEKVASAAADEHVERVAPLSPSPASLAVPASPASAGSATVSMSTEGSSDGAAPILVTEAHYRVPPTPAAYPKRARDLNQQGEALIRVRLDDEGNAAEVTLWRSSGFVLLDNAALAAARRWQFAPERRNGMPVIAWVQIPVRFYLN